MPKPSSAGTADRTRLASLIENYRSRAQVYCKHHLDLFFEATGPALLGFGEVTDSEATQSLFFDAVPRIDESRQVITNRFLETLSGGITHFFSKGRKGPHPWLPTPDCSSPCDSEENLALKNLIIQTNAHAFPELYALSQRLAVIAGGSKLRDHEIPAGPHHLAHGFRAAISPEGYDIRVKVVLYALLHHYLTWGTAELYHDLNSLLRDAGILPRTRPVNLRPTRRSHAQLGSNLSHSANTADHEALHHALVENLLELAAQQHRGAGKTEVACRDASARQGNNEPSDAATDQGRTETQTLGAFLGAIKDSVGEDFELPLAPGGRTDRIAIAALDKAGTPLRESELFGQIGQLFAQMLDLPGLPAVAKAQLARLQTLYLRNALDDISLIRDPNHPARHLFEECIEAASIWVDESDPGWGALPVVRNIVERLLASPASEPPPFADLLEFLQGQIQVLRSPKDRSESRCRDLRRDPLITREARHHVENEIEALLRLHDVPPAVRTILETTWTELLVLVRLHRHEGPDSPGWREAIDTARSLVELFDPRLSGTALRARIAELPRLRQRLSKGAHRLGSFNRASLAAVDALLTNAQGLREQRQRCQSLQASSRRRPVPAPTMDEPAPNTDSEPDARRHSQAALLATIEELRKTRSGTWFELNSPLGDNAATRIQLSWISPLTSTYLFLDETGGKTEMRGLEDLARAMLSGRARVIEPPDTNQAPPAPCADSNEPEK